MNAIQHLFRRIDLNMGQALLPCVFLSTIRYVRAYVNYRTVVAKVRVNMPIYYCNAKNNELPQTRHDQFLVMLLLGFHTHHQQ